jgi:threonine synthase
MGRLLGDELGSERVSAVCRDAFDFPVPLVELGPDLRVLELFHGPTLAFKDFGARFMAHTVASLRSAEGGRSVTVLTATSGDTGGAVADAFHGLPGVRVFVLYPRGRVSAVQEGQFAGLGGNITALAVEGSFDDCQALVKGAFGDPDLVRAAGLTSANSINVGRLLPQSLYYAWATVLQTRAGDRRPPVFVVPSGNFGNLTAGLLAKTMGTPAAGFVAATNRNDVVPEFLAGAPYALRPSVATPSSAMDVGDPSNWERVRAIMGDDRDALRSLLEGSAHGDEATLREMGRIHADRDYLADPHTSVGLLSVPAARSRWPDSPVIVLATAHPAKFPDAVVRGVGVAPPTPEVLREALERPNLAEPLEPTREALRSRLLS